METYLQPLLFRLPQWRSLGAAFTPVETYLEPLPLSPSVAHLLRLWKLTCSPYHCLPQWRSFYACGNLLVASTIVSLSTVAFTLGEIYLQPLPLCPFSSSLYVCELLLAASIF